MKYEPMLFSIEHDNAKAMISIPYGIYSKDAILKVCYKYLDLAYVKVEVRGNIFLVEIKSKDNSKQVELIADLFCNDLVDYELRSIIASQTKDIRSALVEKAFLR
jgi:His-Xaa-Ser system protein HxsD